MNKLILSTVAILALASSASAITEKKEIAVHRVDVSGVVFGKEGRSLINQFTIKGDIDLPTNLLNFVRETITFPSSIKVVSFIFDKKMEIKHTDDEWVKYFAVMNLKNKKTGKALSVPQSFFVNKEMGLITSSLASYERKLDYSDMTLNIQDNMYLNDDIHIISGNKDSKHKVVIFSDPMCPVCVKTLPDIIAELGKYPELFVVYDYNYPLSIHPVSDILTRIKIASKVYNKSPKEVARIFYKLSKELSSSEKKTIVVLRKVDEVIGKKTGITVADLNDKRVMSIAKKDRETGRNLAIFGTPSIYIDSEIDVTRMKYKEIIKNSGVVLAPKNIPENKAVDNSGSKKKKIKKDKTPFDAVISKVGSIHDKIKRINSTEPEKKQEGFPPF